MARSRNMRREIFPSSKGTTRGLPYAAGLLKGAQGSAILEFAIVLPLLVVFVVGIYDFSGAFNQKQKIERGTGRRHHCRRSADEPYCSHGDLPEG